MVENKRKQIVKTNNKEFYMKQRSEIAQWTYRFMSLPENKKRFTNKNCHYGPRKNFFVPTCQKAIENDFCEEMEKKQQKRNKSAFRRVFEENKNIKPFEKFANINRGPSKLNFKLMREGNLGRLPNIAESPNITMRMVVDILKVIQSEKQNTEVDYKKIHEKLTSLDSWKSSIEDDIKNTK